MKQVIDLPPPPSGTDTNAAATAQAADLPPPPADSSEPTATPAAAAAQIWIRPPIQTRRETCPYTHLGHAAFYAAFVANPRIRQAKLGKGKTRGTRLLWLPDVYRELERMAATGGAK